MTLKQDQEMADQAFIQKAYQQMPKAQPSEELDENILRMAHKHSPKQTKKFATGKGWLGKPGLSIAASVFILSALFWQYQDVFNPTRPAVLQSPTQADMPTTEELVFSENRVQTQIRERVVTEELTAYDVTPPDFQAVIEQLNDAPKDVETILASDEVRLLDQIESDRLQQQNLLDLEQEARADGGILSLSDPKPQLSELDINTSVEQEVIAKANEPVDWQALDNLLVSIKQTVQSRQISSKGLSSFSANGIQVDKSADVQALYQALFDILDVDPELEIDKKYLAPLSDMQRKILLDMQKNTSTNK